MNRIFILISLFSSTILLADEVETVDGSILQGEILTIEDNNLTILTEFAGKIKIPDFRISRISCENELSFRMEDNRTFQGKINFSDEGKFSLENRQEPFLLSEVNYGGRITDEVDRRTIKAILSDFLRPAIMNDTYKFSPSGLPITPCLRICVVPM